MTCPACGSNWVSASANASLGADARCHDCAVGWRTESPDPSHRPVLVWRSDQT